LQEYLHQINQLERQDQILVADTLQVVVLVELKDQLDLLVVQVVVLMVETMDKLRQLIPIKALHQLEAAVAAVVPLEELDLQEVLVLLWFAIKLELLLEPQKHLVV
tara:strand:- start:181 stop:498 length:318 start_codon:yes stop_codon:yes gene_type:complete